MKELDNLVGLGKLKTEPPAQDEFDGLIESGLLRLNDAENRTLALASRFDLAYNAAHALALAALRHAGYRSDKRYLVFQCLEHTLGILPSQWRVLDLAHGKRNKIEYDGHADIDSQLVESVIAIAREIEKRLKVLRPIPP